MLTDYAIFFQYDNREVLLRTEDDQNADAHNLTSQ